MMPDLKTWAIFALAVASFVQALGHYAQGEKIRQLQERVAALEAAP